jgi:hypothetical protein
MAVDEGLVRQGPLLPLLFSWPGTAHDTSCIASGSCWLGGHGGPACERLKLSLSDGDHASARGWENLQSSDPNLVDASAVADKQLILPPIKPKYFSFSKKILSFSMFTPKY